MTHFDNRTNFEVNLLGYLNNFHKDTICIMASTVREALSLLQNYLPKGAKHTVDIEEVRCLADLDIVNPEVKTLTIKPTIVGAGGGGKKSAGIQIGIGILLFMVAGPLASSTFGQAIGLSKGAIILTGAQLVLGGALQLLQKTPKADPTSGDKKSRFINVNANTIEEGTPIPLIYGLQKVYGQILSFDIDSEEYDPS